MFMQEGRDFCARTSKKECVFLLPQVQFLGQQHDQPGHGIQCEGLSAAVFSSEPSVRQDFNGQLILASMRLGGWSCQAIP